MEENKKEKFFVVALSGLLGGVSTGYGSHGLVFSTLAVGMLLIELIRKKNDDKKFDTISIVGIFIFFIYVFVPFCSILQKNENISYVEYDISNYVYVAILIFFGYFCIVVGYAVAVKECNDHGLSKVKKQEKNFWPKKSFGTGFLLFSILSFIIYSNIYGGPISLFKNADIIRAGYVGNNPYVFFRQFLPFSTIGAWIFISSVIQSELGFFKKCLIVLLVTLIPLSLSVVTFGRLDVLFVFIPVILFPYLLFRKSPSILSIGLFSTVGILWLMFGGILFENIAYGKNYFSIDRFNVFSRFIREFIHPHDSIFVATNLSGKEIPLRMFSDFFLGVASLLPDRLVPLELSETISFYNTYNLTGIFKSIVPPGVFGFFYYCLKFPGVVLLSFVLGIIIAKIENLLKYYCQIDSVFYLIKVGFLISLLHYIMAGDPRVYLQTYFFLYTSTIFLMVYLGISLNNEKTKNYSHYN